LIKYGIILIWKQIKNTHTLSIVDDTTRSIPLTNATSVLSQCLDTMNESVIEKVIVEANDNGSAKCFEGTYEECVDKALLFEHSDIPFAIELV